MFNLTTNIIQSWSDLGCVLREKNLYTTFLLKSLVKKHPAGTLFEKHHIQPFHMGGVDKPWNTIVLSYEDHGVAHKLLYELYGVPYDKAVSKLRLDISPNARSLISKANVERARQEGTGRFSSALQRELGQRPKKARKPTTRKEGSTAALSKGMVWVHKDGARYVIPGNQMQSVQQVAELLSTKCPAEMPKDFQKKQSKSYLYTGITKILNGWRDPKTNKALFSVGPWRLEGLLIK